MRFFFFFFILPFFCVVIEIFFQIEFSLCDEDDRVLVDATEVTISRPTVSWLQTISYSGYKKKNTLKYEVAISEDSGMPISFSGPFFGPTGDISIFRSKLKEQMIEAGYIGLADGTYQGEDDLLIIPPRPFHDLSSDEKQEAYLISKRRILVENLFFRVKVFKILSTRYRHNIFDHFDVFSVVLHIIKIDLKTRPLRKQR
jgi:DDE superfamily endonuclease